MSSRNRDDRRAGIARRRSALPLLAGLALLVLGNGLPARANITIKAIYDTTITNDPNSAVIQSTINSAIQIYQSRIADPITVTIQFQETTTGLGSSSTYFNTLTYAQYRDALLADATTADDSLALSTVPIQTNNPVNGSGTMRVTTANLRALGFNSNPPVGNPDGFVFLNTSIMNLDRTSINPNKYDLMAVAMHEIDEVLGFESALNGLANGAANPTGAIWGLDLFRYSAAGTRSLSTSASAQSYFSIDGGATSLVGFNQNSGGDFSDWYSIAAHTPRVQDAFGTPAVTPDLGVEFRALDVIGYNVLAVPEPTSTALTGLGLLAGAVLLRRRRAG